MPEPWDRDHGLARGELGARLARALVAGRFAGGLRFAAPEVAWFAEGWDCDVFRAVDAGGVPWLCKLPKRATVQPWIRKEALVLEALHDAGVPVAPRLGLRGEPGELPYTWTAVSIVPGRSLLAQPGDVDPRALGRSFGATLRAIHPLEPDGLGARPASVVHRGDAIGGDLQPAFEALRRHVEAPLVAAVEASVARARACGPEEAPVAFVHGDVFPEHVFVDAGGAVTGLIDWADAAWGDPAGDFWLAWLLGDAFLDAALCAYGSREPDALRRRAVRTCVLVGIHDVEVAERGAPNVPLEARIRVLRQRAAEGWLDRIRG